MNQNEISRIDRITETINELLNGNIPELINPGDELDEIQQLSQYVNQMLEEISSLKQSYTDLSNGKLSSPIKSNLPFAHSLKNLQATLNHLTWQTNQIAKGDFTQHIDFLGEFSDSFNCMVKQLQTNRDHLEELIKNRTNELSLLLDTTIKTSQMHNINELFNLISKILIQSLECHTYCRIISLDKTKKYFQIKSSYSIRPLKCNYPIDKSYELNKFKILKKITNKPELKDIYTNPDDFNKIEKDFLFMDLFKSTLIIPFVEDSEVLDLAIINEARDIARSSFSIDFYRTLSNHLSIVIHNAKLFQSNKSTFLYTIEALAAAIDQRDAYTHLHSKNVTKYAVKIAKHLKFSENEISDIRVAALLHDIGKIGIKDDILLKPSKLTNEEIDIIKTHPERAVKILESVENLNSVIPIIAAHHERYDGRGYPRGLKGDNIPVSSRIIAVADTFDAITTKRVYRDAMTKKVAIEEIKKCSGTQFDPKIVNAFLENVHSL